MNGRGSFTRREKYKQKKTLLSEDEKNAEKEYRKKTRDVEDIL